MRVLIHTIKNDGHAQAVKWALERKDCQVSLLFGADFPALSRSSLSLEPDLDLTVQGPESELLTTNFDVVWHRRLAKPMPAEHTHPSDQVFIQNESEHYLEALRRLFLLRTPFEINPLANRVIANLKPIQLATARKVGFCIPSTLISNQPERIREFVRKKEKAIAKSMTPHAWWTSAKTYFPAYARVVTMEDLRDDETLAMNPLIYQEFAAKAEELRVTVIGSNIFQARIQSNNQEDWRRGQFSLSLPEKPLDERECQTVLNFMRAMGLVFGCFDFIRRPDGQLVFLEVNEMGQWGFVEKALPNLHLLDCFTNFVLARDPLYRYQPQRDAVTLAEFEETLSGEPFAQHRDNNLHLTTYE